MPLKQWSVMKSIFYYFDWFQFFIIMLISTIGLSMIFSATHTAQQPFSFFFKKQLVGFIVGIGIYFGFVWVDYRTTLRWGYFGFLVVIGLLIFTLLKGTVGMGAQRWVNLFFFKLQPSELTKLFFPPFAAYYLHSQTSFGRYTLAHFFPLVGVLAVTFVLILKQPDLGTAILTTSAGLTMLWFAGLSKKFFIYSFIALLACTPLFWKILKPYQKNRIAVFMGRGSANKERYQIEQAAIAIGSGGLFGKGFLKGTQNKLRFLPETRTDFIFAVLCEETGFLGSIILIILFLTLLTRIALDTITIVEPHIQMLVVGLALHILLSVIINIGMVTSLLPIVGIPLPLMSYGLCNLWVCMASLGWLHGIVIQRRVMGEFSTYRFT